MTSEKWVELTYESYALGRILAILPGDLLSIREARIQAGKLSRMVTVDQTKNYKGFEAGLRILAGGSIKKMNKEQGKRAAHAGQQARKVRVLCDKVFKEFLRFRNPKLTNTEYREWRKLLDKGIAESSRQFVRDVMERVAQKQFLDNPGQLPPYDEVK